MKTRETAIQILTRVEQQGSFLSDELGRAERTRGVHLPLLQKLVKGGLSRRAQIDAALTRAMKGFPSRYSVEARWLFRLAAYQLRFLERVSPGLVLHETKTLGKKFRVTDLAASLDALRALRNGKDEDSVREEAPEGDSYLAEQSNHPDWVVNAWIKEFGKDETEKLCEANNKPWPVAVRANSLRTTVEKLLKHLREEGVRGKRGKWSPSSIVLEKLPGGKRLNDLKSLKSGFMQVQDESATLVTELLDPHPGELVIDMCAAPGGKATHCAELMQNKGKVIALDLNPERLRKVGENCKRLKISIIQCIADDALHARIKGKADKVLLDAPCSGLGVLGRKTDVRWLRKPEQIAELTALQDKLLERAEELLKPEGVLVYSTCTLLEAENEERVRALLKRGTFSLAEVPEHFPRKLINKEGFLKLLPHRHGTGGAFAARLIRTSK